MHEKKRGRKNPKNPKSILQRIRARQGLTQSELAALSGVGKSSIALYERLGFIHSAPQAKKLATALNVTLEDLLDHEAPKPLDLRTINSRMYQLFLKCQELTQDHRNTLYKTMELHMQALRTLEKSRTEKLASPNNRTQSS